MPFEPLKIEDLRIGHYVKLECSWWRHPFATNTFKVTTKAELQRIKKISKLQLFYDPDLSDPVPDIEEDLPMGQEQSFPDSSGQAGIKQEEKTFDLDSPEFPEEAKENKPRVFARGAPSATRSSSRAEESTQANRTGL